MKASAIITILLTLFILPTQAKELIPSSTRASAVVTTQASAIFNAGTNALEISMQSNGKPESILVYVSRSNGTVVHFEYVTITSETTVLKIDLTDEDAGTFNLRLHGNSLQYAYAFKKTTP